MRHTSLLLLSAALGFAIAKPPGPFDEVKISAADGSISTSVVPVGATITELWVKDKFGKATDVVLGYDDPSRLLTDPAHPYFNSIIGRYANRIKNGTFSIPITKNPQPPGPNVFQVPNNDRDGQVALHGGPVGWDRRNWTLVEQSKTSLTFKLVDEAFEGFPGTVTAFVTHTVANGGILHTKMKARATKKTPIMMTTHFYFNLDGFKYGVNDTLGHTLQIQGSKVIDVDGNLIPTGKFINVARTPFDFRKPKLHGKDVDTTVGLCQGNCTLYDHCWVYDKGPKGSKGPLTILQAEKSGIQLEITTDQDAVQIYSSWGMNSTGRKVAHGGAKINYGRYSGVAIEQQNLIDAINTPEWGVDQIYGPNRPYEWTATHKFSVVR